MSPKIAIWAPSHNFVRLYLCKYGICRQLEKKLVKWRCLLHMSSHYGELRPTNGLDLLVSLGHPSKFQPVLHLGFITAPTSLNGGQPNFARCLAISCTGVLHIYTFWGLLPPNRANGVLSAAKFTLHPSLAFFHIGSVSAWHSSSERQPKFAAWYKEWNYGTFAEGGHLDGVHMASLGEYD